MDSKLSTTPEEMFMLLGEQHFINHRLTTQVKQLYQQIDEMANEITRLHGELNGRLEQPNNNDAV